MTKKRKGKRVAAGDVLVGTTTMYRCEYMFRGNNHYATSPSGLADFKDGFWVDVNMKFTKGSDCRYWIPPERNYLHSKGLSTPVRLNQPPGTSRLNEG